MTSSLLPWFYGRLASQQYDLWSGSSPGIDLARMKLAAPLTGEMFRRPRILACVLLLVVTALPTLALTPVLFAPVREQLTNDIAVLSALPQPSLGQRLLLRKFNRAEAILDDSSKPDGRALLLLSLKLGRLPAYANALHTVASNLVAVFNNEYHFVGSIILELPTSSEAESVEARFADQARTRERLNNAITARRVGNLYDPAKRRLDNLLARATAGLIIPFPGDMLVNSVEAKVNGINFRTTVGLATENLFEAVVTSSNIMINLSAVDLPRGFVISVPNAQPGSFRYGFTDTASFVNRIGLYNLPSESSTAGTNGAIYVSTTATEAYGSFRCSGDGFQITDGRFRITLSSAP